MKVYDDFGSRTSGANALIEEAKGPRGDALNQLMNFFYFVSYPFEAHERNHAIRPKEMRADIREKLLQFEDRIEIAARTAGWSARDQKTIAAAGLRGIFQVVGERFKTGHFVGNGHHAMQEAAANAVIKVAAIAP